MPTVDRTSEKDKRWIQETYQKLQSFEAQDPERWSSKPLRGPSSGWTQAQMSMLCLIRSYFNVNTYLDVFRGPWPGYIEEILRFKLPHYTTFVRRLRRLQPFLKAFFKTLHHPEKIGLLTVDSSVIPLGKPYACHSHFCYKGLKREGLKPGVSTFGTCFGLKIHLVLNAQGFIVNARLTSTHEHDLKPIKQGLLQGIVGIVLADSGYVSQPVARALQPRSIALWARPKQNQDLQFCPVQKRLYRLRQQVEKTFESLKSNFMLVARRPPRTLASAEVMVWSSLIAFQLGGGKHPLYWNFNVFKG